jgi:hypothetical protein
MFSQFQTFILACCCVLCLLLGGGVVHSCDNGMVAKTDSTVTVAYKPLPAVHDTIRRDSIRVVRVPVAVGAPGRIHDTIWGSPGSAPRQDSATCYSVSKDTLGAHIQAQICSDSFPRTKPLDLMAMIYYQAPPIQEKTIHLTTTVIKPGPLFSDWRFYLGCTATLIAGAFIGHNLK